MSDEGLLWRIPVSDMLDAWCGLSAVGWVLRVHRAARSCVLVLGFVLFQVVCGACLKRCTGTRRTWPRVAAAASARVLCRMFHAVEPCTKGKADGTLYAYHRYVHARTRTGSVTHVNCASGDSRQGTYNRYPLAPPRRCTQAPSQCILPASLPADGLDASRRDQHCDDFSTAP